VPHPIPSPLIFADARRIFLGSDLAAGFSLDLQFNDPLTDSRTPDIFASPNIGVVYTGGTKTFRNMGGAYDDRNLLLIVSDP